MRYIKKTDTLSENSGIKETQQYIKGCWNSGSKKYINLFYDRSRLRNLEPILFKEQSDASNNSYCCYCMRKLYLHNTVDGHDANVTLEHIIPNKITEADWTKDKSRYQSFKNLDSNHLTICFKGELTDKQKETEITDMPFPHFVSYHNLVASCDGKTYVLVQNCHVSIFR